MQPRQHRPGDPALTEVLALIRRCFAEMDGRIDPPSSMLRLDAAAMAAQAGTGEIWSIGAPPQACVFLAPQGDALYLSKLAVAPEMRRRGLAAALIGLAEARAGALGLPRLRLQTRVELTENHATFARLGFAETGRTRHPGYVRATSVIFEKPVPPQQGPTGSEG